MKFKSLNFGGVTKSLSVQVVCTINKINGIAQEPNEYIEFKINQDSSGLNYMIDEAEAKELLKMLQTVIG